jgi:outer membrane protein OmpA-like peptidoglycan-associated protein
MGSKSILLLSLLVGGLITWLCYNDHKNSILLKNYQIAQNDVVLDKIAANGSISGVVDKVEDTIKEDNESSDEVEEDTQEVADNVKDQPSTEESTPAELAVIDPSFSYNVGENMNAKLSPADESPGFAQFVDSYCADGCSKDVEYSQEVKKATWHADVIRIASFLKDNNIKDGSISIKDSQYVIEGEIEDSALQEKLNSLIEPLNATLKGENKIVFKEKEEEKVEESLPQVVNTNSNDKMKKIESLAEKQETIDGILKTSPIYFELNSDKITKESTDILDEIIYILTTLKDYSLEVQGHTDSVGSSAYNKKLSQKRADAVKAYLIKHGVSTGEISSTGYGEERPIDINSKSKINRRVEIHLKGGDK